MERGRQGRLPWAIVLIIVVFCCAAAYAGAMIWTRAQNGSTFTSYSVYRPEAVQKLEVVNNGFVYYDGSSLTKVSDGGNIQWNYIVGVNADFKATRAGVASWVGNSLTLISAGNGTPTYSGNMDSEILSATLGSEYAAVLLGPEHNSTIVLMEAGGNRVDSITLSDQTVIDYGFFFNDTLFWVMTLDTNGTAPSCTVSTYRPGRRLVGSISDNEQTFYHASFQQTQISCTGDTFLKYYTYNGTEDTSLRTLVYGWTLVDEDDYSDNPMMAFTLNGEYDASSNIRDIRLLRGTNSQVLRMPYDCMNVLVSGDRVFGFSPDGYIMAGRMGQQKVDAYQTILSFDRVYGITGNNIAVLANSSEVYLVNMK